MLIPRAAAVFVVMTVLSVTPTAQIRQQPPVSFDAATSFVEVAEPGAVGAFQLVPLAGTVPGYDDLLIYDKASGEVLLVRNLGAAPYRWVGPVPFVHECFAFLRLRPGMTWAAMHLDADGRHDLIGHDSRTGEVVRYYQRGIPPGCGG